MRRETIIRAAAASAALVTQLGFVTPVGAQSVDAATIREMQRIIQQQQQQLEAQARVLEALRGQVQALSEQPTAPAPEAERPTVPASEQPKVTASGEERVKLTLSGQVDRGVLFTDDGHEQDFYHVDNDNSSTRFRLLGLGRVTDDFSIGTDIEVQFKSNSTAEVNQLARRNVGSNSFTERKLELYLDSKRFGRLSIGQGYTATDYTSEVDLSGTIVIATSDIKDMAGGILFRDSRTNELLTDVKINRVFDNFDGLDRDDRLRYDTPKFAGFQASTSAVADDRWDVALRFGGDFGPVKAAAAIGYADPHSVDVDNRISGSASLLHTSGLNLTFAAGRDDHRSRNPDFWFVKLGYIARLFEFGDTAFAIDYAQVDDVAARGDEATTYGAFAVQSLEQYGTDFYLGVRNHELDRPGTPTYDILATLAGARVKF